jgi:hypothetical protein
VKKTGLLERAPLSVVCEPIPRGGRGRVREGVAVRHEAGAADDAAGGRWAAGV